MTTPDHDVTGGQKKRFGLAAIRRWWLNRTLHARVALLVTVAVAVALIAAALLAWTAVVEIQHRQVGSELQNDAGAIAAQPAAWRRTGTTLPDPAGPDGIGPDHHPHDLGARWQIVDASGIVVSTSTTRLPVTSATRAVASGARHDAMERLTLNGDRYLVRTVPAVGGGAVQVAINLDPSNHTLTLLALWLIAGCVVGVAAAAVLGRAVARAGLAPVQRLADDVQVVADTMDLRRAVEVRGDDEVGRLGGNVNRLLTAIDTARQAQRTLVEDAGHELRTPLTSLRTNVELLLAVERHPELAHRLPAEDRSRLLADLESQLAELTTLTTELIELSREATTREATEQVELTDVVEAALARARTRAPRVTFEASLMPVTVQGRPGELERMVLNVLDNAAKWSPPEGLVRIEVRPFGVAGGRIEVRDGGPGIEESDRPHVFDRFYRAASARGMPGSGLGLAIVAQTAHQHEGSVQVSPAKPQGTLVTIQLPRTAPPS